MLGLISEGISQSVPMLEKSPAGFNLLSPDGEVFLEFPRTDWLRFSWMDHNVKGKFGTWKIKSKTKTIWGAGLPDQVNEKEKALELRGALKDGEITRGTFAIRCESIGDKSEKITFSAAGVQPNSIQIRFRRTRGAVFGGGIQFSHVNLDGHKVPLLVEEQGIGRGDRGVSGYTRLVGAAGSEFATYFPYPVFWTPDGHGVLINSYAAGEMDFTDPEWVTLSIHAPGVELIVFHPASTAEFIKTYTGLNGRLQALPDWAFGTILGVQGGVSRVDSMLDILEAHRVPVSAVWIQDWVGKRKTSLGSRLWWDWYPDQAAYPNIKDWIATKRTAGTRVLGYMNTFLAMDRPTYREAEAKNILVEQEGKPWNFPAGGFDAALVDIYKPAGGNFLVEKLDKNMVELGFSGWMADFGEWYPQCDADKDSLLARHNEFPAQWALANEVVRLLNMPGDSLLIFHRSGYLNSMKNMQIAWVGDQTPDYGENDGMPSALRGMLSAGLSGIQVSHSDIGGYTNVNFPFVKIARNRDVFYRWCELGAFSPIFRTHEGLKPEKNIQPWTDTASVAFFGRMATIHDALLPYFRRLRAEAMETGMPFMRHLVLHYPEDSVCADLDRQFLLGADLLVIPVMSPDAEEVRGYLPEGEWKHAFSGESFAGKEWHIWAAPYGKPAVFIRKGGASESNLQEIFSGFR